MEAIARSDDRRRMDAAAQVGEGALLGYACRSHDDRAAPSHGKQQQGGSKPR
jgi:hypothetical protein